MEQARAYSGRQFFWAVNIAALLGWVACSAPILLAMAFQRPATGEFNVLGLLQLILIAAGIGLPIAFIACWSLAGPALWVIMKHPVGWLRAAVLGFLIPAAMASVLLILLRLFSTEAGTNASYWTGLASVWTELGLPVAFFAAIGLVIGLIVRGVIGPGRRGAGQNDSRSETAPIRPV